jgi:uncharacterized membrane protein
MKHTVFSLGKMITVIATVWLLTTWSAPWIEHMVENSSSAHLLAFLLPIVVYVLVSFSVEWRFLWAYRQRSSAIS